MMILRLFENPNVVFTMTASTVYTKELLTTGNGYPLYIPEPNASLPEAYQRRGIHEGDVGILNPDGSWDFLFNVCKSHDDLVNAGRTPDDFEWIEVQESYDVSTTPGFFKPGSHVASTTMKTGTFNADISAADNPLVTVCPLICAA
jgi:hypothetical protein